MVKNYKKFGPKNWSFWRILEFWRDSGVFGVFLRRCGVGKSLVKVCPYLPIVYQVFIIWPFRRFRARSGGLDTALEA